MNCPRLNNLSSNPLIVTIKDIDQPRLSNYATTVGTTVTLTCSQKEWILQPNNPELVCLASGAWDKVAPKCVQAAAVTESPGLSEEQKLIIGITGGVGGVVFIILVVLIAAICRIQRKARERRTKGVTSYPPRTEVTSVGSLYALNKSFGNDKGYPPSYATRDHDGAESYYANRIALPSTSREITAYRNPAYLEETEEKQFLEPMARDEFGYPVARYREDPRDFISPRSREIPLDVSSARRPDDYRYPLSTNREIPRDPVPENYGYQGNPGRGDPRAAIATRGLDDVHYGAAPAKSRSEVLDVIARERMDQLQYDRQRFSNPDRPYNAPTKTKGQRSSEAVVRAERTLQYVEEHSSGSPTPIYGESRGFADMRQGEPRGQDLGDYDRLGRGEDVRGNPRYTGAPQDPRVNSVDRRHYTSYYGPARNVSAPQGHRLLDESRYASSVPDYGKDISPHWRPNTKTHFTGNRVR